MGQVGQSCCAPGDTVKNDLIGESTVAVLPKPHSFVFQVNDVSDVILMPPIAYTDKSISLVYMYMIDAKHVIYNHQIYPTAYNISPGTWTKALLLFPTKNYKTELTLDIICHQLRFQDLKRALQQICKAIHEYCYYSINVLISRGAHVQGKVKYRDVVPAAAAKSDQSGASNDEKKLILRHYHNKRSKIILYEGEILVIDIVFRQGERKRIPARMYEAEQSVKLQQQGRSQQQSQPPAQSRKSLSSPPVQSGKALASFMQQTISSQISSPGKSLIQTQDIIYSDDFFELPSFTESPSIIQRFEDIPQNFDRRMSISGLNLVLPVPLRSIEILGDTSYLNAVTQALGHVNRLTEPFLQGAVNVSNRDINPSQRYLTHAYYDMIWQLFVAADYPVWPKTFHATLSGFDRKFNNLYEHCAADWIKAVLKAMHTELNLAPKKRSTMGVNSIRHPKEKVLNHRNTWNYFTDYQDSMIVQNFNGMFKCSQQCFQCNQIRSSFEVFLLCRVDLPVKGRKHSLEELFTNLNTSKAFKNNYCPSCESFASGIKTRTLFKLPPALIIHLNRFPNTFEKTKNDKNEKLVTYPVTGFDMSPYVALDGDRVQCVYDLVAVICHSGGVNTGHYWTQGKRSDGSWYSFSKAGVRELLPNEVVNEHAYLLIYDLQY